jgi:hypothetical protein
MFMRRKPLHYGITMVWIDSVGLQFTQSDSKILLDAIYLHMTCELEFGVIVSKI